MILCMHCGLLIDVYAIVRGPQFRIWWKDIETHWETEDTNLIAILEEALCSAPALKMLDIRDSAGQIVICIDCSPSGSGGFASVQTIIMTGTCVTMKVGC